MQGDHKVTDHMAGLYMTHDYFRKQLLQERMNMLRIRFTKNYLHNLKHISVMRLNAIDDRDVHDKILRAHFSQIYTVMMQIYDMWDSRQYASIIDIASMQYLDDGMMFEALFIDLFKCMSVIMLGNEEKGLFSIKECFEDSMPPRISSIEDIAIWAITGHVLCYGLILTNDRMTSLNHMATLQQYSSIFDKSVDSSLVSLHDETIYLRRLAECDMFDVHTMPDRNTDAVERDTKIDTIQAMFACRRSSSPKLNIRPQSKIDEYIDHKELSTRRDCTSRDKIESFIRLFALRPGLNLKNAESTESLTVRLCQTLKSIVYRILIKVDIKQRIDESLIVMASCKDLCMPTFIEYSGDLM
jgi:hypothetical protein